MKLAAIAFAALLVAPAFAQEAPAAPAAAATCAAPAAPEAWAPAPMPAKPIPPKCLNLEKRTTTCSKKVFDGYNADIEAWNKELRARIDGYNTQTDKLNKYVRAASLYADCEHERIRTLIPKGD